jgi:hypothetical protein
VFRVLKCKQPDSCIRRCSHTCHVLLTRWTEYPVRGIRGPVLWRPASSTLEAAQLNLGPVSLLAWPDGPVSVNRSHGLHKNQSHPAVTNPRKNKCDKTAAEAGRRHTASEERVKEVCRSNAGADCSTPSLDPVLSFDPVNNSRTYPGSKTAGTRSWLLTFTGMRGVLPPLPYTSPWHGSQWRQQHSYLPPTVREIFSKLVFRYWYSVAFKCLVIDMGSWGSPRV